MVALLLGAPVFAQEGAPWDFETAVSEEPSPPNLRPEVLVTDFVIGLYRQSSDRDSIHRCLFHVSCSHFAQAAVERQGLIVGAVMFIDRYFYRENQAARALYPLVGEDDGTYRLSDATFVP